MVEESMKEPMAANNANVEQGWIEWIINRSKCLMNDIEALKEEQASLEKHLKEGCWLRRKIINRIRYHKRNERELDSVTTESTKALWSWYIQ